LEYSLFCFWIEWSIDWMIRIWLDSLIW
jgi:hypothetical protein